MTITSLETDKIRRHIRRKRRQLEGSFPEWSGACYFKKNTVTHNFKSIISVGHKKINGWEDNRAIPIKKAKKNKVKNGVSKPKNVSCRAGRQNCL